MDPEIYTQVLEQLKKANKILIALPQGFTADNLASGLALFLFLGKLQKDVELAGSGTVPENLSFLPALGQLKSEIAATQSLVVSLNTSNKKLAELSYQTKEDHVSIYLKSKDAPFTREDVSFSEEKFPVDLVVVLDAPSLGSLGPLFEHNPDFFYETPKINIDNKAVNEFFGAINLVDMTATSVAEILATLFERYETQVLDEDIATALLTGIIAKTNSFQHAQTTPHAFLKASDLVALGGRQQEIIKHIFKTKPLSLLKLWGRALARLKTLDQQGGIYAVLSASDFEKSEGSVQDLWPTLLELANNVSSYRLIAILAEPAKDDVHLLLALHPALPAQEILSRLPGSIHMRELPMGNYQVLEFNFSGMSLEEAEQQLREVIFSLPKI